MPHSSGGGSHSGGVHFSSHSSSSRSSSSISGSAPSPSVSRRPYPGAARYVYYDRRTFRPRYLYLKGALPKPNFVTSLIAGLIWLVLAGMIGATLIYCAVDIPVKTDLSSYNPTVVLEDRVGLISDTEPLRAAMERFTDTTGVAMSLEIVGDAETARYTDLETYAYNEYLRLFDDEKHWLFVIEWPEGTPADGFVDWKWEGVIGDEVGQTVSDDMEDESVTLIQRALLRSDRDTLEAKLIEAIGTLETRVMEKHISWGLLIIGWTIGWIGIIMLVYYMMDYQKEKLICEEAVRTNGKQETGCPQCGSRYVPGTLARCKRCGNVLQAEKEI